ncbi:heme-binding domain-containing protein [Pedobacter sp. JCM 36344]|uniref:heme-binding domain-containing protein n=1 Tax=Pedobacter sp. JCM 36344 TaxID=3374280 RepID=UPI00397B96FB
MSWVTKGFMFLLLVLITIQFIQPTRNKSRQASRMDITRVFPVPEKINGILKNSCYDCHSNNTRYPWYAMLQPGGWLLASHIKKGKQELNFNEFGSYSRRIQQSKLKSIGNSIKDETMPLSSYTLIHRSAKLSQTERDLVTNWVEQMRYSLL